MTRPPRNQSLVIAVTKQQMIAIDRLRGRMSRSQYVASKLPRKFWVDVDKMAIMIQTGAASNKESGDDR